VKTLQESNNLKPNPGFSTGYTGLKTVLAIALMLLVSLLAVSGAAYYFSARAGLDYKKQTIEEAKAIAANSNNEQNLEIMKIEKSVAGLAGKQAEDSLKMSSLTASLGTDIPLANGAGATGDWGINITGNAATVTNATSSLITNAVTIGTANGLSLTGQELSLLLASDAQSGALSNADWITFNNKTTLSIVKTDTEIADVISKKHAPGSDAETAISIGDLIDGAAVKVDPVDSDYLPLMDSEASNIMKKLSWAYVKSVLKTYFDGIYSVLGHKHTGVGGISEVIIDDSDVTLVGGVGHYDLAAGDTYRCTGLAGNDPYELALPSAGSSIGATIEVLIDEGCNSEVVVTGFTGAIPTRLYFKGESGIFRCTNSGWTKIGGVFVPQTAWIYPSSHVFTTNPFVWEKTPGIDSVNVDTAHMVVTGGGVPYGVRTRRAGYFLVEATVMTTGGPGSLTGYETSVARGGAFYENQLFDIIGNLSTGNKICHQTGIFLLPADDAYYLYYYMTPEAQGIYGIYPAMTFLKITEIAIQ
jgi:hypothetical protein